MVINAPVMIRPAVSSREQRLLGEGGTPSGQNQQSYPNHAGTHTPLALESVEAKAS